MNVQTRLKNLVSPYDLYERHTVVSQLLQTKLSSNATSKILDVGGRSDLLERFLPYHTISINPDGTGLLIGDGGKLPFAANTFDAVVNIDTLEHLPSQARLPFIQECLRVSNKYVIVAAPYGNSGHIQLEKELNKLHKQVVGRPHQYLSEHVEHGLPNPEQLISFVQALAPSKVQLYYAGDYSWQGRNFARAVQVHQKPYPFAIITQIYNRFSEMALFHPVQLTQTPEPKTNRFYLFITK